MDSVAIWHKQKSPHDTWTFESQKRHFCKSFAFFLQKFVTDITQNLKICNFFKSKSKWVSHLDKVMENRHKMWFSKLWAEATKKPDISGFVAIEITILSLFLILPAIIYYNSFSFSAVLAISMKSSGLTIQLFFAALSIRNFFNCIALSFGFTCCPKHKTPAA